MIKNLPQGWRVEELNKCGKIVTGKTPSKLVKEYWNSKDIPFVKPDDFKNDDIIEFESGKDFISKQGFEKATKIPPYSVLVTCIGNIGKILINKNFITTNQQINTIIPHKNIHYKYLAYAIQKIKPIMIKRANAPVVPIINKTDFGKFEIPIPPLPQQEKIVKVLDNSSSLVEQQKQLIKKYDVFLKSKFIEMFGKFLDNMLNSKSLKEVCHFIDYRGKTPNKVEYGIKLITAKNVKPYHIEENPAEYMDVSSYESWTSRGIVKKGDVLFTTEAPLGNTAKITTNDIFVIGQRLIALTPKALLNSDYLVYCLSFISIQNQINKKATGSTVKGIRSKELAKIILPIPPLELQNKFASIVEKIEAIKEKETQKLNHLETLHVSLMDKAFKGEIG